MPHIHTIEEDYEYRMKNIIKKFKKDFEIKESGDDLYNLLWQGKYALDFGKAILDDMYNFSGEELFTEQ